MIPNIVHFVYGFVEQTQEFEYFKCMAIKSAHINIEPSCIYFWCHNLPHGIYWEEVKHLVIVRRITPPKEIFGKQLCHYAHQADVVRLQILRDYGGIYLDIDTVCLRSFSPLLNYDFVIGTQDYLRYCNAVILCSKNNAFINEWYESYRTFRSKGRDIHWDEHSCLLPRQLILEKNHIVKVMKVDAFYSVAFVNHKELFSTKRSVYNKIKQNKPYCLHLWESKTYDMLVDDATNNKLTVLSYLYKEICTKRINVYQTISNKYNVSKNILECTNSWNYIFKDCSMRSVLSSDIECLNMIKSSASNRLLKTYLKLIPGAFRSDVWRLFQLYYTGGLYVDSHIRCLNYEKLLELLHQYDGILVRDTISSPSYIYNAFMYFKNVRDPTIGAVLEEICTNVENEVYPEGDIPCLHVTGPGVHGKVLFELGDFDKGTNVLTIDNRRYYILEHLSVKNVANHISSVINMKGTPLLKCRCVNYRSEIQKNKNGLQGYDFYFDKALVYGSTCRIDVVMLIRDVADYCDIIGKLFDRISDMYPHLQFRFYFYENDSTDATYAKSVDFVRRRKGQVFRDVLKYRKFEHELSNDRGEKMAFIRNKLKELHGELSSDYVLLLDSRVMFSHTCLLSMILSLQTNSSIGLISGYGKYFSNLRYYDTLALIYKKESYYGKNKSITSMLDELSTKNKTIECDTCFGGMALVPTHVYNQCSFWVDKDLRVSVKDKKTLYCEHHGFCKDIRNMNKQIILNPSIVYFKHKDDTTLEEYMDQLLEL